MYLKIIGYNLTDPKIQKWMCVNMTVTVQKVQCTDLEVFSY